MGRKSWATDGQEKWLLAKIPKYRLAQRRRNLKEFQAETASAFLQKFPLLLPGETAASHGGESDVEYMEVPSLATARKVWFSSFINVSKDN